MTYTQIITHIKSKLEEIPEVQEYFAHLLGKDQRAKKYPAVIFVPDTVDNEFSTNKSNHRTMNFRFWVIVNSNNIKNVDIYERILPNVVDAVLDKFDAGWDFGTVGGSRAWARMGSGQWGLSVEEKSVEAWAELVLTVRFDKDI